MRMGLRRWSSAGTAAALLIGLLVVLGPSAQAVVDGGVSTTPAGTVAGRVEAGGVHTCGIRTNGTVACWGADSYGESSPPGGTFSALSSGVGFSCGLRSDAMKCWGRDESGQASPPHGVYRSVSAGHAHACAIRSDGTIACWGHNSDGRATPPTGTFLQVASGGAHTCAIREDGTVACWGDNGSGQATPPSNSFLQISAGGSFTCGVRFDHQIACWGDTAAGEGNVPSGTFRQVAASYANACAVRSDGTVACWGDASDGQSTPRPGTFIEVSGRLHHMCGVRTNGTVACWGSNDSGQRTPPSGTFSTRTTVIGGIATCGIRANGTVSCWGSSPPVASPQGTFTQVATSEFNACGIATSGQAVCWGYEAPPAPSGTFFDLTAGNAHYCGIAGDGAAVCWGNNGYGQTNVVPGVYRHVSAGTFGTCAVRSYLGQLVCWGNNTSGQFSPPGGTYATVDTGETHTCALHASGAVDCFGSNTNTFPATWGFSQIDAGAHSATCGIVGAGHAYCWGNNTMTYPFGAISQLSVDLARLRSCGLFLTGLLDCSGEYPAASPPTFTGPGPHVAVLGQPYSYTFDNDGQPAPRYSLTAHSLPPGLHFIAGTGRITGTPTQLGSFTGVVTATNEFFADQRRDFGLVALRYRSISVGDIEPVEPTEGSQTGVPVTLSAPVRTGQVSVSVGVVADTATSGVDYYPTSVTLKWAPGDPLTKTVQVYLLPDSVKEIDERFRVVLSQPHNAGLGDPSGVVTIRDDDGMFHVTATDGAIREGDGGTAQLRYVVALDARPAAGQTVKVHVATANGTATAGPDYTAVSTTLTWTATDPLNRLVTVPVRGDNAHEPDETVRLIVSTPTPGALVMISDGQATGTIVDND